MEPGTSREILSGAGYPKPSGVREETPGKEARGGEDSTVMSKRRGADAGTAEEVKSHWGDAGDAVNQIKAGEGEDTGKYEEELDPRIQACNKIIIVT